MDRWGIYIFVDRLLNYAEQVRFRAPFFPDVSKELFMHLVVFEIFHHEFYHHLVESAATTLEIVADALIRRISRIRFGNSEIPRLSHPDNPPSRAR
jgi:hypothetical protein